MKVDGSLRSLIQGVSQQPPRNRLPGQCTAQDNMSSNPVDGLTRRPPMKQIATLFSDAADAQFYEYSLGTDKNFTVAALPGDIRVFETETGIEKTVNVELSGGVYATDYLDGGDLAFTTLDGATYIANRNTEVAMLPDVASYVTTGSIVYLLGANYGRTYSITVDWSGTDFTVSWTAPDGSTAAHTAQITTVNVATQLTAALNANATFTANFSATRDGDVIYIKKTSSPTTQDFEVRVDDGDGGENLIACNNSVKDVGKLPSKAPQGYVVQITGDASADADDWYVQFDAFPDSAGAKPALGAGFGRSGQWLECVAPGVPYKFDKTTMPHVLNYDEGTDVFTLNFGDWQPRAAGDLDSNEDPSFVGNTIEDLGYFQGRLVMLSGPAVIMSRTNKPLDFWLESATVIADSDPIDIQSTIKGVRKMYRLVPYNRDLVVFADKGQFIVFGRNSLTPLNSSLVLTTAFEAEILASPVAAGRNIFFSIRYGKYAGVREFFTESAQDTNDSRPVTQHVLKYLKGNAVQLATSSNFDNLIVRTDDDPKILYLYEYIWQDDRKAQSSWSRWIMPNNVVHVFFMESVIYFITKIGNDYIMNSMDLDIQNDEGLTYQTKLDRKKLITNVHTTITNPYTQMPADPLSLVFVQGEGCPYPGMRVLVDSYNAGAYTLKEDMEGGSVYVGVRYLSRYVPTMPSVKDSDNVKIGTGSLIVSKFLLNFKETGEFVARIFSKYADDVLVKFTGRIVGDPSTVVGEPAIIDGTFTVPFRHNADLAELEIYTDSHEPATFMDIEWKGQYTKKGRRIATGGN